MRVKRMISVGLTAILVVGLSQPAAAELCKKCRGKAYIMTVGQCSSCDGHTTSGAFKLCKRCSAEQGKCEHCLARLDGSKKPPKKKPSRPKPIDPNKSGTYSFGKWRYRLKISAPGTRSEGKWGQLFFNNKTLPSPELNDHYRTPWGLMYWVGNPKTRWGRHGWMRSPSRQVKRKGRLLPSPEGHPRQIELTAADNRKTVTAVIGKTIVISLKGNVTTGYGWQTAELTGKAVKQTGKPSYVTRPPNHRRTGPGMVGVGGTFVFKFKAVKPGKATLKLVYVRPWEKDKPPERTFAVTVEVRADTDRVPDRRSPKKKPPGSVPAYRAGREKVKSGTNSTPTVFP